MQGNGTTLSNMRQQRAVALIPTVRPVQGGYRVAASTQDAEYLVTKPNGHVVCTCPDFGRHGETDPTFQCKHILAVDMAQQEGCIPALGNGKVVQAMAASPPLDTLHLLHRYLTNEDPVRLKLIKNTKGYSWEIAVADVDAQTALARLKEVEQQVRDEFGTSEEGA